MVNGVFSRFHALLVLAFLRACCRSSQSNGVCFESRCPLGSSPFGKDLAMIDPESLRSIPATECGASLTPHTRCPARRGRTFGRVPYILEVPSPWINWSTLPSNAAPERRRLRSSAFGVLPGNGLAEYGLPSTRQCLEFYASGQLGRSAPWTARPEGSAKPEREVSQNAPIRRSGSRSRAVAPAVRQAIEKNLPALSVTGTNAGLLA